MQFCQGYIQIHTDVKYDPTGLYSVKDREIHTIFNNEAFTCKIKDDEVLSNSVFDEIFFKLYGNEI